MITNFLLKPYNEDFEKIQSKEKWLRLCDFKHYQRIKDTFC